MVIGIISTPYPPIFLIDEETEGQKGAGESSFKHSNPNWPMANIQSLGYLWYHSPRDIIYYAIQKPYKS